MAEAQELPPKPEAPLQSDCCGTGCSPCVFDIYEQDLKFWNKKCEVICHESVEFSVEVVFKCNFYKSFEIININKVTSDTNIYTFKLPQTNWSGLKAGQHIVIKGVYEKSTISRPYTPISDLDLTGKIDILIKLYPKGKMSNLVRQWKIGDRVEMRGPFGSFVYRPNAVKRIVMLAAGTGIAPMFQIIKVILNNEDDFTKITLLYASKSFNNILLREDLYSYQSFWNFSVCHYLSKEENLSAKKYLEIANLHRMTKKEVIDEIRKMEPATTMVLISGTKSFDKDMINAVQNIKELSEDLLFKF